MNKESSSHLMISIILEERRDEKQNMHLENKEAKAVTCAPS
jgi:hypothetical protein